MNEGKNQSGNEVWGIFTSSRCRLLFLVRSLLVGVDLVACLAPPANRDPLRGREGSRGGRRGERGGKGAIESGPGERRGRGEGERGRERDPIGDCRAWCEGARLAASRLSVAWPISWRMQGGREGVKKGEGGESQAVATAPVAPPVCLPRGNEGQKLRSFGVLQLVGVIMCECCVDHSST